MTNMKGLISVERGGLDANPFSLTEQVMSPLTGAMIGTGYTESVSDRNTQSTPLGVEEVKLCYEMIEGLKETCQNQEQSILDLESQIASLKNTKESKSMKTQQLQQIDTRELQCLVKRLTSDLKSERNECIKMS